MINLDEYSTGYVRLTMLGVAELMKDFIKVLTFPQDLSYSDYHPQDEDETFACLLKDGSIILFTGDCYSGISRTLFTPPDAYSPTK